MTGPASSLDFLLNAENVADLTDRMAYVDALAQSDAELSVKVANRKNELTTLQAQLEEQQAREVRALERARNEKSEVAALFDEQQRLLGAQQRLLVVAERTFNQIKESYADWLAEKQADIGNAVGGRVWNGGSLAPFDGVFEVCPVSQPRAYGDGFGAPRYAGGYHLHKGVDIVAPLGTEIHAPFDGHAYTSSNSLGGNVVFVVGAQGTVYNAHLNEYSENSNSAVSAGEVIGYVGSTGSSTTPHDHFEFHPNVMPGWLVRELLWVRRDRGRDQPVPDAAPSLRVAPTLRHPSLSILGSMRPADIRHVGVVGAGLMGSGIVEVCARAGLRVTFVEGSEELVAAGRGRIERSIGRAVERGKLDAAAAEEALGRIDAATELAALADVDLVIEAATEDRAAKAAIFDELGGRTRPEVVLASNTSSIPIGELGAASGRPGNVIGMHFFNPPPVMALLELTPSDATTEETFELVRDFGTDVLGKTCVRSGDQAGFIVNRLLVPYLFDAIRLYESGFASREDIDTAMRLGLAHPMGPLTLSDLIGLDTLLAIGEVLREAFPGDPRYEAPALLRDLVAQGKLGKKTGGGFTDA